ncbi:MAG: hypothetical protein C0608_10150 [Deltaproteobacteria bacterium]|nr:MAG: hypothetical protein C0608_10150 [Deltaproteobacteria bacterium]
MKHLPKILFLILLVFVAFTFATQNTTNDLEIVTHELKGIVGVPIRVVQISDVHLKRDELDSLALRVSEEIKALSPDIIVATGDMVNYPTGMRALNRFLDLFPRNVPLIAVSGNWEASNLDEKNFEKLEQLYAIYGGSFLDNGWKVVEAWGMRVGLCGVRDKVTKAELSALMEKAPKADLSILLSHRPDTVDLLADEDRAKVDLVLSGHTHGGQFRPYGITIVPQYIGEKRLSGFFTGSPPLYVNRGVGTTTMPVRLGVKPEIAVFDFIP